MSCNCQSESRRSLPGQLLDYDRSCSDDTWDSDNSDSMLHYSDITHDRNIDFLVGDSDSESSWQGGDSDRITFSLPEFLRST